MNSRQHARLRNFQADRRARKKAVIELSMCEVCGKEKAIGVASVPAVPYSAAYCRKCIEADAHPWGILIGNTAMCGGLGMMADFWKEMVENTCKHLGKTMKEFEKAVAEQVQEFEKMEAEQFDHATRWKSEESCCEFEDRSMEGGCRSCGDPAI